MPTRRQTPTPPTTTTSADAASVAAAVQAKIGALPTAGPTTSNAATPRYGNPIGVPQFATDPTTGQTAMHLAPQVDQNTGKIIVGTDGKPVMSLQPVQWTAAVQQAPPGMGSGLGGVTTQQVAPRYYEGDAEQIFNNLPPGIRAQLQDEMIMAGVYGSKKPNIVHGIYDQETAAAFKQVLTTANSTGLDYATVIQNYQQVAKSQPAPPPAAHINTVTNATDLIAVFKKASRTALGREISDSEAQKYVGAFQAQERGYQGAQNAAQDAGASATLTAPPSPANFADQQLKQDNPGEYGATRVASTFDAFKSILGGIV